MFGNKGTWVGLAVVGAAGRHWFFQDYPAGSGPNLVISRNDNGTMPTGFDPAKIVDSSAVVVKQNGEAIYSTSTEDEGTLVKVTSQTGTNALMNATPAAAEGVVRLYYLYAAAQADVPPDGIDAPNFVTSQRSENYDLRYLNSARNLADITNASQARLNIGLINQTTGAVLFGDGETVPASDPTRFFYDSVNKRLGIGLNAPLHSLHVYSDADPVALIESQNGGTAEARLQSAAASNGNLASGAVVGLLSFYGRFNNATSELARVFAQYQGSGTSQVADLVFQLSNGAADAEVFRLKANGGIKTVLASGVLTTDATGLIVPSTVQKSDLEGYQAQINSKQAAGNYITALTGDVVANGPGSAAATIQANVVSNAKLAQMATNTIKGNNTGGAANASDLTVAQVTAMLNVFTSTLQGLVPASGGGTSKFLRSDGTWASVGSAEKAGIVALTNGTTSQAVVFTTARADALYTPFVTFEDTVSGMAVYLPCTIISHSASGFTVEWGDSNIGSNMKMNWGTLTYANP